MAMASQRSRTNVVHAPQGWRCVDFISDLHLQEQPAQTFLLWQAYMAATRVDALFILGDLFEVWVGDDVALAPRTGGFEHQCLKVLQNTAQRLPVYFMRGNRDFLIGPAFLQSCGVTDLDDPCLLLWGERRYLLAHGDALCLGDTDYQAFRAEVRTPQWQQGFLRRPLDERRAMARQLRDRSEARKKEHDRWIDVDEDEARRVLRNAQASLLIHGHTHRPAGHALGAGLRREVLSDWDGAADPPRSQLLRVGPVGLQRLSLAVALAA
jgi:UDP-2,3-diacylglucosamine hydrolase